MANYLPALSQAIALPSAGTSTGYLAPVAQYLGSTTNVLASSGSYIRAGIAPLALVLTPLAMPVINHFCANIADRECTRYGCDNYTKTVFNEKATENNEYVKNNELCSLSNLFKFGALTIATLSYASTFGLPITALTLATGTVSIIGGHFLDNVLTAHRADSLREKAKHVKVQTMPVEDVRKRSSTTFR